MPAFLAPLLLKLSPLGRILKAIPRQVWIGLAIIAAVVVLFLWHQHRAHAAISAAYVRGYTKAVEDDRKEAEQLRARINALTSELALNERKKNDEANRRIARDADDVRLRGPGKARCASVPVAPRGSEPLTRDGDAARPQVPAGDLAAVPWAWLVGRAEQCDLNRAEALSWRSWYAEMLKAWPKG